MGVAQSWSTLCAARPKIQFPGQPVRDECMFVHTPVCLGRLGKKVTIRNLIEVSLSLLFIFTLSLKEKTLKNKTQIKTCRHGFGAFGKIDI